MTLLVTVGCVGVMQAHGQDKFVPMDQLAPREMIPAARFLLPAYAFVWVALVAFVFTLWRRLGRVERELAAARREIVARSARSGSGSGHRVDG
jgi:CcmD family protein